MPLLKGRFRPATSTARYRTSSESERNKSEPIKCTVVPCGPKQLSASQDSAFKVPKVTSKTLVVGIQPPAPTSLMPVSPRKIPTMPFSPSTHLSYLSQKSEFNAEDSDIITDANRIQDKEDSEEDIASVASDASGVSDINSFESLDSKRKTKRVRSIQDIDKTTMTLSDVIRMRVPRNAKADDNPLTKIWSDLREREERESQRQDKKQSSEKEKIARLIKEAEDRGEKLNYDDVELPEEEEDESIQVKLDEKGNIVVNENTLYMKRKSSTVIEETVEEDENEVGYGRYEDYKTNLYSYSRRKKTTTKRWNDYETEKFYMALRKVGTDFELMAKIMPGFSRDQLKKKFKREEKLRLAKIDLALNYAYMINDRSDDNMSNMSESRKRNVGVLVEPVNG